MQEIWKPIKEFENHYEISNYGNVRSLYKYDVNKRKYILRKVPYNMKVVNDRGYLKLHLKINGKRKTKYIHRLVAEAFIPNPKKYKEVNHIDSNPSNCNVNNLEWCDRSYNIKYMQKHQNEIKERNEMRIEILENIYYGIDNGIITIVEEVKKIIDKNLLENY